MPEPSVEILLATYNGEKFLIQQIESLLNQSYPAVTVLARDDGSLDNTPTILYEYESRFPQKFHVLPMEKPTGAPQFNFLRLMKAATSDFVMFSDQDDVWDADKVSATMEEMQRLVAGHGDSKPLLVFSDLEVVHEDLSVAFDSFWQSIRLNPEAIHDLPSLLRQNVVTGSTMLINHPLLKLGLDMPPEAVMHDWWLALVASTFGHGSYLKRTTTKYRQHSSNVLGAGAETGKRHTLSPPFSDRAGWATEWSKVYLHASAFLRLYTESLPQVKKAVLEDAIRCTESSSRFERLFRMLRHQYFRGGLRSNVAMLLHLWNESFAMEAVKLAKSRVSATLKLREQSLEA